MNFLYLEETGGGNIFFIMFDSELYPIRFCIIPLKFIGFSKTISKEIPIKAEMCARRTFNNDEQLLTPNSLTLLKLLKERFRSVSSAFYERKQFRFYLTYRFNFFLDIPGIFLSQFFFFFLWTQSEKPRQKQKSNKMS